MRFGIYKIHRRTILNLKYTKKEVYRARRTSCILLIDTSMTRSPTTRKSVKGGRNICNTYLGDNKKNVRKKRKKVPSCIVKNMKTGTISTGVIYQIIISNTLRLIVSVGIFYWMNWADGVESLWTWFFITGDKAGPAVECDTAILNDRIWLKGKFVLSQLWAYSRTTFHQLWGNFVRRTQMIDPAPLPQHSLSSNMNSFQLP